MPRKKGINTVRLQAVLNTRDELESSALEVREKLLKATEELDDFDDAKWTDRKLIRDGLIELGKRAIEGYKPPRTSRQAKLLDKLIVALESANRLKEMLEKLDLTSVRSNPEWNEDVYEAVQELQASGLRETAVKMFSTGENIEVPNDW